jgi:hypothetical protein
MFLMEVRYVICEVQTVFLYSCGGQLYHLRVAHFMRQLTPQHCVNKIKYFPYLMRPYPITIRKCKAILLGASKGPESYRRLRLPDFKTVSKWKVARLSALSTGRLYTPGNIPGTHFCYRLSRTQDHSAAARNIHFLYTMSFELKDIKILFYHFALRNLVLMWVSDKILCPTGQTNLPL